MFHAIEIGDISSFRKSLRYIGVDPSIQNNKALKIASENGRIEIIKLLLKCKRVYPTIEAIKAARNNDHIECMYYLLEASNDDEIIKIFSKELRQKRDAVMNIINFYDVPIDLIYDISKFIHSDIEYYKKYYK
jgi:hypothetical protein